MGATRHNGTKGIGVSVLTQHSLGLSGLFGGGITKLAIANPIGWVPLFSSRWVAISDSWTQRRRTTTRSDMLTICLAHGGLSIRPPALTRGVVRESRVTLTTTARSSAVGSNGLFPDHFSMPYHHKTVTDRQGHWPEHAEEGFVGIFLFLSTVQVASFTHSLYRHVFLLIPWDTAHPSMLWMAGVSKTLWSINVGRSISH